MVKKIKRTTINSKENDGNETQIMKLVLTLKGDY